MQRKIAADAVKMENNIIKKHSIDLKERNSSVSPPGKKLQQLIKLSSNEKDKLAQKKLRSTAMSLDVHKRSASVAKVE